MAKVFGPDKIVGLDIGSNSYNADKKTGLIEINNKKDLKAAIREGMVVAGLASGFNVDDHRCVGCGFNSVFVKYTCPKCSAVNDFSEVEDGSSD